MIRKKRIYGRKTPITKSDIWKDLLKRVLEILNEQESWISTNEMCRIINKEFDICLKSKQIGFIVHVLKFKHPIEGKKSSNPFYKGGARGLYGKRDRHSTFPKAYMYFRIKREEIK